uniref:Uncharacterized protein n=1 Tax=Pakpunavirus sp. TaxID=2833053 RepID=A0AB39BYJ9_9CAUD
MLVAPRITPERGRPTGYPRRGSAGQCLDC